MDSYWDRYLRDMDDRIKDLSPRELLKDFYDYLDRLGKIKK